MNHAQKYLASLAKVIKSPNLPGLDKFVVKMYLAVTATNMYTQTSPDYTYAVKLVLINTCYGGGGGGCDILSVSDFSVPKTITHSYIL